MDFTPLQFINEHIEVQHPVTPLLEKKPGAPATFFWRGETYTIVEIINEWHDYTRRGRMNRNMTSEHSRRASQRGSWGVGRDYFRVRTQDGKFFDLCFDRSPKNVDDRQGNWFLEKELAVNLN